MDSCGLWDLELLVTFLSGAKLPPAGAELERKHFEAVLAPHLLTAHSVPGAVLSTGACSHLELTRAPALVTCALALGRARHLFCCFPVRKTAEAPPVVHHTNISLESHAVLASSLVRDSGDSIFKALRICTY